MDKKILARARIAMQPIIEHDQDATARRAQAIDVAMHDEQTLDELTRSGDLAAIDELQGIAVNLLDNTAFQALEEAAIQAGEDFRLVTAGLAKKYENAPELEGPISLDSPQMAERIGINGRVVKVTPDERTAYKALDQAWTDRCLEREQFIEKKIMAAGLPEVGARAVSRALEGSYQLEAEEQEAINALNKDGFMTDLKKKDKPRSI